MWSSIQAMNTTKMRKKKMRTPNIFIISQRLEVTDWKYLQEKKVKIMLYFFPQCTALA